MEPATPIEKQFNHNLQVVQDALGQSGFYIELTLLGVAVVVAWLVSMLVRGRVNRRLASHPPRIIDAEFITRPLSLLAPLLALLNYSIIKPFAEEYAGGTALISAFVQLTLAYGAVHIILLVVRSKPMAYFISLVIIILTALEVTGFMAGVSSYLNAMAFDIGKFRISMLNFIHGTIILVLVFWSAGILSRTLESYLRKSSGFSYNTRELIVKFFKIFVYLIAFLITLSAMGIDLTALAIFGGALGVGIGLGLQKITANFVSGVTLLLEKSIKIGDLIEISGVSGWVRQLNIRYALVETADGRELLIPNEQLISTQVTNWTHSNEQARVEIRVVIPFEADAGKAQALMLEAAKNHPRCLKGPPVQCFLREFGEFGLVFNLHFWIPDIQEGRLLPQSEVMFAIIESFKKAQIPLLDRSRVPL